MTDFTSLDPDTRCYALVGRFLSEFAELEACLNMASGKFSRESEVIKHGSRRFEVPAVDLRNLEKGDVWRIAILSVPRNLPFGVI